MQQHYTKDQLSQIVSGTEMDVESDATEDHLRKMIIEHYAGTKYLAAIPQTPSPRKRRRLL